MLTSVSGVKFYNTSQLDFSKLTADVNNVAASVVGYMNGFSPNVRAIFEKFKFGEQVAYMAEKDLLYRVIKEFQKPEVDLSPARVDNTQMGYVFEELIRIGAEQSNEEAGDRFTPREVIQLMVNLLLSDETDLAKSHVVKTIYDPTCGTGACSAWPSTTCATSTARQIRSSSDRTSTTSRGRCARAICSSKARTPTTSNWAIH